MPLPLHVKQTMPLSLSIWNKQCHFSPFGMDNATPSTCGMDTLHVEWTMPLPLHVEWILPLPLHVEWVIVT